MDFMLTKANLADHHCAAIPQLPGGRQITLDHCHHGMAAFVLVGIDPLDMNSLSLPTVSLPKLPCMDLGNVLSTIMVSYTELFQIKKLVS